MKIQISQPQAIHELGGRKNQEDSIYPLMGMATAENRIFVVCDGMGGMDKGEVASAAVRDAIGKACESMYDSQLPFTDEDFNKALQQAYDALDAADVKHEGTMGTTMTFICFHAGGCLVAHIGDSRIYHLRPSLGYPGGVRFRSRDHSLVQQLYDLGEISYNGMATSPRKNIILKAMQPFQDGYTKASFAHITDVKAGDYFYLCTDGMLEQMEDEELLSIVGDPEKTDAEKAEQLKELTKGNADNHSAYLIRIENVLADPGDESLESDELELRAKNKALNDTRKDEVWSVDLSSQASVENVVTRESASSSHSRTNNTARPKTPAKKNFLLPLSIVGVVLAALLLFLVGLGVGGFLFFGTKGTSEQDYDVENAINEVIYRVDEVVQTADAAIVKPQVDVEETENDDQQTETSGSSIVDTNKENAIGQTLIPQELNEDNDDKR